MSTDVVPLVRAAPHYLATLTGHGNSLETVRLYCQTLTQFGASLGGDPTLGDVTLATALHYRQ